MRIVYLVPFVLGMCAVLQAGLNRVFGARAGFASAVVFNGFVVFACTATLFLLARHQPQHFPAWFRSRPLSFQLWYVVPGLCGVSLILGIPWAINKIGALRVFILIIAGQLTLTLFWDYYVEHIPASALRIAGAALTLAGAWMASVR